MVREVSIQGEEDLVDALEGVLSGLDIVIDEGQRIGWLRRGDEIDADLVERRVHRQWVGTWSRVFYRRNRFGRYRARGLLALLWRACASAGGQPGREGQE